MRYLRTTALVFLLAIIASPLPAPDRCGGSRSDVVCGMVCKGMRIFGTAYCDPVNAPEYAGCVQLFEGCGSMQYVECCDPNCECSRW